MTWPWQRRTEEPENVERRSTTSATDRYVAGGARLRVRLDLGRRPGSDMRRGDRCEPVRAESVGRRSSPR